MQQQINSWKKIYAHMGSQISLWNHEKLHTQKPVLVCEEWLIDR